MPQPELLEACSATRLGILAVPLDLSIEAFLRLGDS